MQPSETNLTTVAQAPAERLLSGARELSAYLREQHGIHLAADTILTRRSRDPERLPPSLRFEKRILYRRADVDEWVAENLKSDAAIGPDGVKVTQAASCISGKPVAARRA